MFVKMHEIHNQYSKLYKFTFLNSAKSDIVRPLLRFLHQDMSIYQEHEDCYKCTKVAINEPR